LLFSVQRRPGTSIQKHPAQSTKIMTRYIALFAVSMCALATIADTAAVQNAHAVSVRDGDDECDEQLQFDMLMCKSHMCTKCVLAWCTESCQKVQKDYPTCRCKDWPSARASYSSGDFEGKGKFGDAGDYA